jgi:hypothetical protein
VVIAAVPRVLGVRGPDSWRVSALTAATVGTLHGAIFWTVRRRERHQRAAAVADARGMLQHVVNNQLMVVLGHISLNPGMREDRENLAEASQAIRRISGVINALSDESVRDWKSNDFAARYVASSGD